MATDTPLCQYLDASFLLCSLEKKASALGAFQALLTPCDTAFLLQNFGPEKNSKIYSCSNAAKHASTYIQLLGNGICSIL